MKQHKHAAIIKSWADGAQIQIRYHYSDIWVDCMVNKPSWGEDFEYRVKPPEPPQDVVKRVSVSIYGFHLGYNKGNLILTFDGESGKLKKAEVCNEQH